MNDEVETSNEIAAVPATEVPRRQFGAVRFLPGGWLCESCGCEMTVTSPRQKRCEVCRSPEARKERHRLAQRDYVQRKLISEKEQAELIKYANLYAGTLYACYIHAAKELRLPSDRLMSEEDGREYFYNDTLDDSDFVAHLGDTERFIERGGLQDFNWRDYLGNHKPSWKISTEALLKACRDYLHNKLQEPTHAEESQANSRIALCEEFAGSRRRIIREYRDGLWWLEDPTEKLEWETYLKASEAPASAA